MNCQGKIFAGEIFRGRWTGQGVSGRRTEKRAASHGRKLGRAGSWRNARKTGCWREGLEGTLWRQGVFRERTARAGLLQNIQRSRYLVKYPASPADEPSKSGACRISQAGPLQKITRNQAPAGYVRELADCKGSQEIKPCKRSLKKKSSCNGLAGRGRMGEEAPESFPAF